MWSGHPSHQHSVWTEVCGRDTYLTNTLCLWAVACGIYATPISPTLFLRSYNSVATSRLPSLSADLTHPLRLVSIYIFTPLTLIVCRPNTSMQTGRYIYSADCHFLQINTSAENGVLDRCTPSAIPLFDMSTSPFLPVYTAVIDVPHQLFLFLTCLRHLFCLSIQL